MAATTYKSVTELFRESSQAVRRNLSAFIIVNIVTILSLAWNMGDGFSRHGGRTWEKMYWPGLFGSNNDYPSGAGLLAVIFIVAGIILALMNIILSLRAAQKNIVSLSEVWEELRVKVWRLIGVSILTGAIIIAGLILLIVPGVYLLGRLYFAPYVLIDQNTGIREALNRSWELTRGRMWQVYSVLLFTILLSLANIVPIIGAPIAFVLVMLYSVAAPLRYYELKSKKLA